MYVDIQVICAINSRNHVECGLLVRDQLLQNSIQDPHQFLSYYFFICYLIILVHVQMYTINWLMDNFSYINLVQLYKCLDYLQLSKNSS